MLPPNWILLDRLAHIGDIRTAARADQKMNDEEKFSGQLLVNIIFSLLARSPLIIPPRRSAVK